VAHAEASAKTVDAAVTAAAAQLGLRSDQVEVEVLEEPVPSTFGYIGSPARVRVTPRTAPSSVGAEPGGPSTTSGTVAAGGGSPGAGPDVGGGSAGGPPGAGSSVGGGSAGSGSDVGGGSGRGGSGGGVPGVGGGSAGGESGAAGAGTEFHPVDHPSAQEPSTEANVSNDTAAPVAPASVDPTPPVPLHHPATATETGNGQVHADHSTQPSDQLAVQVQESSAPSQQRPSSSDSPTESAAGLAPSGLAAATADAPGADASASSDTSIPAASAPAAPPATIPEAASSPSLLSTPGAGSAPSTASVPSSATAPETAGLEEPATRARGNRPPRRTYKDEPIEPQMVEEDTERAGDFLEGLLDALDVDGDITTWVDEVGGHIDLEGADLEVLVGPNGETLDALQELTRLAVLRQTKRRVRLLIDINGFRVRQREQLTSMVRATVEQVIRTREDHELQPMSPAERKIVHDAVAAIEGARTESLGEEPNRRVVIRPA